MQSITIFRFPFRWCGILTVFLFLVGIAGVLLPRTAANPGRELIARHSYPLTFEQRVDYQRAIEKVYWQHRTWPKENPGPKPDFSEIISETEIRQRVEAYLKQSKALETYFGRPVGPEQLQVEMDRWGRESRDPALLRELLAALDDNPAVVAECLARPLVVERAIRELFAFDSRIHGPLKQAVETEIQRGGSAEEVQHWSGIAEEAEIVRTVLPTSKSRRRNGMLRRELTAIQFDEFSQTFETLQPDSLSPLQETAEHFTIHRLKKKNRNGLRLVSVRWPKISFDEWWASEAHQYSGAVTVSDAPLYQRIIVSPQNNTWTATGTTGAPVARQFQTAVWTGSEMIVWGGQDGATTFNSGGRYVPATDSWTVTSTTGAPVGRFVHSAVWTGTVMIVWGGDDSGFNLLNSGGRYNPTTNSWAATTTTGAPAARDNHTAVWNGSVMIIWGGVDTSFNPTNTGSRYDPNANSWTATTTTGAPTARSGQASVWTGSLMVVWGGVDLGGNFLNDGARYNPASNTWSTLSTSGAASPRVGHTYVWSGSEMIVWGGFDATVRLNTGGRYNPASDSWQTITTVGAPAARNSHQAVWTGTQMIVWGGTLPAQTNTGGVYDPAGNTWSATTTTNAPAARNNFTAIYTTAEMIVWGGFNGTGRVNTGGEYLPPVACTSPSVTGQPSNLTRCVGTSGSFTVAASGTATLTYQWQRNGVNITSSPLAGGTVASGFTTATLSLSGIQAADATTYRCVVTNGCGNATSNNGTLTVNPLPTVTAGSNAPLLAGQTLSLTATPGGGGTFTYAWTGPNSFTSAMQNPSIAGVTAAN
ncbi:MAG: immunoglobulin domain-containing protein, partial [Blastocatellia bacterium]|nr:immunoglobulin domain-containing protein [Blastocatellia bacterium]